MKIVIFLIAALVFCAPVYSQTITEADETLSTRILNQKSYHIDAKMFDKATVIVNRLIAETSLSEEGIMSILDEMVSNPTPVMMQFLQRFYDLPVFIDTGNLEVDNENYRIAKNDWIENNPVKYQEAINSNKP